MTRKTGRVGEDRWGGGAKDEMTRRRRRKSNYSYSNEFDKNQNKILYTLKLMYASKTSCLSRLSHEKIYHSFCHIATRI